MKEPCGCETFCAGCQEPYPCHADCPCGTYTKLCEQHKDRATNRRVGDLRALCIQAECMLLDWIKQHNDYPLHRCWECVPFKDWLRAWEDAKGKEPNDAKD